MLPPAGKVGGDTDPYSGDPGSSSAPVSPSAAAELPPGWSPGSGPTGATTKRRRPAMPASPRRPRGCSPGPAHARVLAVTPAPRDGDRATEAAGRDEEAVAALLGRPPHGPFRVVRRRADGAPVGHRERPVPGRRHPHADPLLARRSAARARRSAGSRRPVASKGGRGRGRPGRPRRGPPPLRRRAGRGHRPTNPGRDRAAASAGPGPGGQVSPRPSGLLAGRRDRPGRGAGWPSELDAGRAGLGRASATRW